MFKNNLKALKIEEDFVQLTRIRSAILVLSHTFERTTSNGRVSGRVFRQHVGEEVSLKTLQKDLVVSEVCVCVCAISFNMLRKHTKSFKPLRGCLFRPFLRLVLYSSINFLVCCSERISPERCSITGPGLNPDVVLPVRYFIIQAVDSNGENLTLSPGKAINTW